MHSFQRLNDAIDSIDGWFTPLSLAIFDSLLTMQQSSALTLYHGCPLSCKEI